MYRLLLVDDEDIEREGMAELIPWGEYGIDVVGTAWNGVEGYEKLEALSPDIVITDIKMPVMNGIELIRRGQQIAPDTVFVVLSGYGEYEFTSQAMELGVRHYILKPCDEGKIIPVLLKVTEELRQKSSYHRSMIQLLPRVREQIFINMLLRREQSQTDYSMFLNEFGEHMPVGILAFYSEKNLDYLEEFVLNNMMEELAGEGNLLLHTMLEEGKSAVRLRPAGNYVLYLLKEEVFSQIEFIVGRIRKESMRFVSVPLQAAVSRIGEFADTSLLYQEIRALFDLWISGECPLVLSSSFCSSENGVFLLDYKSLQNARSYDVILFECYVGLVKMQLSGYGKAQVREEFERCLFLLYGVRYAADGETLWDMMEKAVCVIAGEQETDRTGEKDGLRMQSVLTEVYKNIRNPRLSMQYLAQEVLFMNEDYLGRLFQKNMNEKYSAFLLRIRIQLARQLIEFMPDLKVSDLALLAGYPPDGQYFAKAFKKCSHMSPSEYREFIRQKNQTVHISI